MTKIRKKDEKLELVPVEKHEFFLKMRVFDGRANQTAEINKPLTKAQLFQLDALLRCEFGFPGVMQWD